MADYGTRYVFLLLVSLIRQTEAYYCNCAHGGAVRYDNRCFKLGSQVHTVWGTSALSVCEDMQQNFGQPPVQLAYSRVAVVYNSSMYQEIIKQLRLANLINIWLGAKAQTRLGYELTDYCWMTDRNTVGALVSTTSSVVHTAMPAGGSPPYCLFVNTSDLYTFRADSCNQGSGYYVLCELGCTGTPPPATCITRNPTGACDGALCEIYPYGSDTPSSAVSSTTTMPSPMGPQPTQQPYQDTDDVFDVIPDTENRPACARLATKLGEWRTWIDVTDAVGKRLMDSHLMPIRYRYIEASHRCSIVFFDKNRHPRVVGPSEQICNSTGVNICSYCCLCESERQISRYHECLSSTVESPYSSFCRRA